jgi:hypothetical protein
MQWRDLCLDQAELHDKLGKAAFIARLARIRFGNGPLQTGVAVEQVMRFHWQKGSR